MENLQTSLFKNQAQCDYCCTTSEKNIWDGVKVRGFLVKTKWYRHTKFCSTYSRSSKDIKNVIVNQTMMPFKIGDKINVMMAVEKIGEGLGIEAIKNQGRPLIPSIIFSMHKIKDHVEGHWATSQKETKKVWTEGT